MGRTPRAPGRKLECPATPGRSVDHVGHLQVNSDIFDVRLLTSGNHPPAYSTFTIGMAQMRRPFSALKLQLNWKVFNPTRTAPDSISDQLLPKEGYFPRSRAAPSPATHRDTATTITTVDPVQVPEPLCITGCDLSESCTTHVRQFCQDVTGTGLSVLLCPFVVFFSLLKFPFLM